MVMANRLGGVEQRLSLDSLPDNFRFANAALFRQSVQYRLLTFLDVDLLSLHFSHATTSPYYLPLALVERHCRDRQSLVLR